VSDDVNGGCSDATEIQALLGHESLNTSQGYIDATANATRQAARANRTYQSLRQHQTR
jgi:site-specific recombinase XerD